MANEVQDPTAEYLASKQTPSGVGTGDGLPIIAWAIKGLSGLLNLLTADLLRPDSLPEHWAKVLVAEHKRLGELVDKVKAHHNLP